MGLNILTAAGAVNHGSDASFDNVTIGTEAALFIPSAFTNGNRISIKNAGAGTLKSFFLNTTGVGGLSYVIQGSGSALSKVIDTGPTQLNRPNFAAATFSFGVSGSLFFGMDDRPVSQLTLTGDLNGTGTPGDDSSASQWVGSNAGSTQPLQGNLLFWGKWKRILELRELETVRQWALWLSGVTPTPPQNDAIPWRECVAFVLYGAHNLTQIDYSPFRNHGLAGGALATPPTPIALPYPWIRPRGVIYRPAPATGSPWHYYAQQMAS